MIPFRALFQLPISLLVTSSILQVLAVPVAATVLTPENFKETISEGVWFIEHFSPWCPHCRHFEPTWLQLVEEVEKLPDPGIHLAQVNCNVHGDLCNENKVTGYPQMNLYRDGEFVEMYRSTREFNALMKFINQHARPTSTPDLPTEQPILDAPATQEPEPAPEPEPEPLHVQVPRVDANPSGTVIALNDKTFNKFIDQGPAFIKFFAPWCGHCKKLAPTWEQLGRQMEHKLNIGEVDCEIHKTLCSSQEVTGFPMLFFYAHGAKTEYTGGRNLDQLKAFADQAASPTMQQINADGLEQHIRENSVLYLLLHSPTDTSIVKKVGKDSGILLGSPPVFVSSSQELFSRYAVPASTSWAVVALKDKDSTIPVSMYYPQSGEPENALVNWFLVNRLPTSMELSRDVFQQVMKAPHKPLVVIVATRRVDQDKVAEKLNDIAKKWRLHTELHDRGRDVVFTWMDGGQWDKWLKSMYGITAAAEPPVIIADHNQLLYYNTDSQGRPIQLTSVSIFSAIDGIFKGTVKAQHSENFIERFAKYVNGKLNAIEAFISENPRTSTLIGMSIVAVLFYGVKRVLWEDLRDIRADHRYTKSDRLD